MTTLPRPAAPRPAALRLGKGLAALMGANALAPDLSAADVRSLPLDLLDPSPYQPRSAMDQLALNELADSIRARGILQPILARHSPADPARFQIIAGERRWRAAALAGLHEVPALVRDFADLDAAAAALVENLQRQDLNPIDEAEGYGRLLDEFGLTQEMLGIAVGKSRGHISNVMRLLGAADPVKAALRDGRITAGHARPMLGHVAPETMLHQVLARNLSVRQTEELAARTADPLSRGHQRRESDPDITALEHDLSERLGLRVELRADGKGGVLRIRYRDLDQLDGLIRIIQDATGR